MTGAPDPLYVAARRVLLDAIETLQNHGESVVLVGAQAVYLHTGSTEMAVAEYTTDADLALDPFHLADEPRIADLMRDAGFVTERDVGRWKAQGGIPVDLLVPRTMGGPGRRGARLGPHGNRTARKASGLEAALVDRAPRIIGALEDEDRRAFRVMVAGPGALLVAKAHKIFDRREHPDRLLDKDALDAFRLLRGVGTEELAAGIRCALDDERSSPSTVDAVAYLRELFETSESLGSTRVARALEFHEDPRTVSRSCAALAEELLEALGRIG